MSEIPVSAEAGTRASTLVVLPCSSAKQRGGTRSGRGRGPTVLDWLPAGLADELAAARAANAGWAQCDQSQVLPALQRYQGGLYTAMGSAGRERLTGGPAVIFSGGYGLVDPAEPIGWYEARLKPGRWPHQLLPRALAGYAAARDIRRVVAFVAATGPYQQVVRQVRWPDTVTHAWLLSPRVEGGGAMRRSPRALGEAIAAYLADGYDHRWRSTDGVPLEQERLR